MPLSWLYKGPLKLLADEAAVGSVTREFPELDSVAFFLLGVFFLPLVAGLCGKGGAILIRMGGGWLPAILKCCQSFNMTQWVQVPPGLV